MCKSSIIFGLGSILILSSVSAAQAAQLQIIAGGGIAAPLNEIAAQFGRTSGYKIVIRYGTTPELIKMAASGGPFDVGVVPRDVWKDAAARTQVAPGPTPDVARVGIGVAVRTGAPKPDISTPRTRADAAQGAVYRLDTGERHRHPAFWHIRGSWHHRGDESQDQGAANARPNRRGGCQRRRPARRIPP